MKIALGAVVLACFMAANTAPIAAGEVPTGPEASPEVYEILAENDQWRVIQATWPVEKPSAR